MPLRKVNPMPFNGIIHKEIEYSQIEYPVLGKTFFTTTDNDIAKMLAGLDRALGFAFDLRAQSYYVRLRNNAKKGISLHRLIYLLNGNLIPGGWLIDHKNGNTLDNRYKNLFCVRHELNALNTSKFTGVTRQSDGKDKWFARIKYHGKRLQLGTFESEEGARRAYRDAKRDALERLYQDNLHVLQKAPQRIA